MSDVEKYGLFALVFVAGVLGLAWVLDPADELRDEAAMGAAGRMVVLSRPDGGTAGTAGSRPLQRPAGSSASRLSAAQAERAGQSGQPRTNRADQRSSQSISVSPLDEGLGAFHPSEPPLPYPGEHSVSRPAINIHVPDYVVVKQGDTLSGLAQQHLGKATRHTEISALNPGVDELSLIPGQRLRLPRAGGRSSKRGAASVGGSLSPKLYTVVPGDTLGGIAQKLKGSIKFQDEILAANRDIISDADQLATGMTLRIP